MRSLPSLVLASACAVVLTACIAGGASGSTPSATVTALAPPAAADGDSVITTAAGEGGSPSTREVTTDGSYVAYLVCRGGRQVVVLSSATSSDTPVPCTGQVSRVRYVTDSERDSLTVQTEGAQQWALTVADTNLEN